MKQFLFSIIFIMSGTAIAGDGFDLSSQSLKAILENSKVRAFADGHFVESVNVLGELYADATTYMLKLNTSDVRAPFFCISARVENTNSGPTVTQVHKHVYFSRLCH